MDVCARVAVLVICGIVQFKHSEDLYTMYIRSFEVMERHETH